MAFAGIAEKSSSHIYFLGGLFALTYGTRLFGFVRARFPRLKCICLLCASDDDDDDKIQFNLSWNHIFNFHKLSCVYLNTMLSLSLSFIWSLLRCVHHHLDCRVLACAQKLTSHSKPQSLYLHQIPRVCLRMREKILDPKQKAKRKTEAKKCGERWRSVAFHVVSYNVFRSSAI